jgi:hypothetical protein
LIGGDEAFDKRTQHQTPLSGTLNGSDLFDDRVHKCRIAQRFGRYRFD